MKDEHISLEGSFRYPCKVYIRHALMLKGKKVSPTMIRFVFEFENGYSASVIDYGFGREAGLFELAVMKGGHLCYDTSITPDVIGYLDVYKVNRLLDRIKRL